MGDDEKRTREEIQAEIDELREELDEKEERYAIVEGNDNEDEYNDMLDGLGEVNIGSLSYSASDVLKKVDEIAYNIGFSDFNDEELSTLSDEIADLNQQISKLEEELKKLGV